MIAYVVTTAAKALTRLGWTAFTWCVRLPITVIAGLLCVVAELYLEACRRLHQTDVQIGHDVWTWARSETPWPRASASGGALSIASPTGGEVSESRP